jgi:hypothetical protein
LFWENGKDDKNEKQSNHTEFLFLLSGDASAHGLIDKFLSFKAVGRSKPTAFLFGVTVPLRNSFGLGPTFLEGTE